jgi:diadenosine tetraphosphate (Ap4A) HIT family hydrolase
MYYHYRKARKQYEKFPVTEGCDFCDPYNKTAGVVSESEHALIIKNRTQYSQWEMSRVVDHLMLIPKRHVPSLSDLDQAERADIMNIIADYEGNKHYEIYARSPFSKTRSVAHQHTHLIKTNHKPGRALLFLRRPYIVWRLP